MEDKPGFDEPSVLDYVKSIFKDWSSFSIFLHSLWDARRREEMTRLLAEEIPQPEPAPAPSPAGHFPWRALAALGLALIAQLMLEPPAPRLQLSIGFYVLALALLIWSVLASEWPLAPLPPDRVASDPQAARMLPLLAAAVLGTAAFFMLSHNRFTIWNLAVWLAATGSLVYALWLPRRRAPGAVDWRWVAMLAGAAALIIFFRIYRLDGIPSEPFSDHAEKILDVYDITQGQTRIFFPRNTGREAIQMYWTVLMSWIFGTGLSFLTLKIGTVLFGLFTLPYVYLLGKEVGGRRVGFLALFFTGVSYWPNVISRIGLRFPLYPLFVVPALLYLVRGLRTRNRNDFILCGLFTGLGLHGYSPFRIVPLLVVLAFILYLLHAQSAGARRDAWLWLVTAGVVSFFVFLPLLRYAVDNPDAFSYRALSRLGTVERPLPAPAYQIFFSNLWNALRMFNGDDGDIWVNSLPHRPALDVVSGALFLIGGVLVLMRYLRGRHWFDLFLLASIPVLQLPSVLSLAYPGENPALNRTAGALVPAFLLVAMALDGLWTALEGARPLGTLVSAGMGPRVRSLAAWSLTGLLLAACAVQNFDLVFNKFDSNFRSGAWNSSEMGAVIRKFGETYGTTDSVWVVPYPYWVDTRLPGVWAGIPNRDFASWPIDLPKSQGVPAPKLFIFNLQDEAAEQMLMQLYPNGELSRYTSAMPGKDFMVFFVPPQ